MKKWLLLSLLPGFAFAAETYTIDPTHTFPNFSVSHLGFSTMHGRFNETSGSFVVDRKGDKSAVDVVIKAASVDMGLDKLEEHLRAEDFFNVEKFPEIRYRSTRVKFTGERTATVEGELTLLGVTRPVTLDVTRMHCDKHPMRQTWWCGFDATTRIKRSDFGMKAYVPAVGDDIEIRIGAEGERVESKSGPRR